MKLTRKNEKTYRIVEFRAIIRKSLLKQILSTSRACIRNTLSLFTMDRCSDMEDLLILRSEKK